MNIKLVGKNIEVTDAIKEYIEKRLERLDKFSSDNTDITVTCSVEREEQIVEMQVNQNGEFFRVEEKNNDLYASIDLATDRIERQLRKEKEKKAKKNKDASIRDKVLNLFVSEHKENDKSLTKTKYYDVKPLSVEDAKKKLEDRREDLFLPYVDAETGEVNVIYKRDDGTFGIVLPE